MSFKLRKAVFDNQIEVEKLIAESVRGLSRKDYDAQQTENFGDSAQLADD